MRMEDIKEIWKDINELSGRYSISNLGRIRRNVYSGYKFKCSEKILDLKPRGDGYVDFSCKISGVIYHFLIHRLVATYFIKNIHEHPVVNHIDHDKSNNAAVNLEWTSYSSNTRHWVNNSKRKADSSIVKFEPMDGEIFRTIDNASKYQISNFGRVVSFFYKNPRILKPNMSAEYPSIQVKTDDGKSIPIRIHKAVATYFVENSSMLPIVNHKDGNKKNYHYSNLEWCSHSDNAKHAVLLSENRRGENHHKSIMSNHTVIMIAEKIRAGESSKSIREQFGISSSCFWRISSGVSYRNITGFELKEKSKTNPLTRNMVLVIKSMLANMMIKDVCIATGLSLSCISQISQNRHKFSNNG